MSERKIGQAPCEGVLGNPGNAEVSGDVGVESVQIVGGDRAAVEVEAKIVDELAEATNVTNRNIVAVGGGVPADRGIRVDQGLMLRLFCGPRALPRPGDADDPPNAWFKRKFRSVLSLVAAVMYWKFWVVPGRFGSGM